MIRPYQASDRADVLALTGSTRALASENVRVVVARDDADALEGWAIWYHAPSGHATGVYVALVPNRPRLHFWQLLEAAILAAMAEGVETVTIPIQSRPLKERVEQETGVTFAPEGRNVRTGRVVEWTATLTLPDALAAVRRALQ